MAEELLLVRMVGCPACEQPQPLQVVNPRVFTVASRASDRQVTSYRWLQEPAIPVLPHHYRIWQCPKCLYADLVEAVEASAPGSHEAQRTLFTDMSLQNRMILDGLRELVPTGPMNQVGAIGTHLAALLITGLPTVEREVDHAKRGRIALRLGWLFRELDAAPLPRPPAKAQAMTDLAEATERLDLLVKESGSVLAEIQAHGRLRGLELRLPEQSESNPYVALGELIEVRLEILQAEVATLQMAVLHDQQGRLEPARTETEAALGEVMARVVQSILPFWPDLPRTEHQCLLLALEALEYSHQHEANGANEEHGVAQVNLILDLMVRLGQLERALDWTAQIARFAADTASDLQQRIHKGKASRTMSIYDETVINRKIAALDLTRQKAAESRQDLFDLMRERDQEQITALLAETGHLPVADRVKALADAGIHAGVLAMLSRELTVQPKKPTSRFKQWLNS